MEKIFTVEELNLMVQALEQMPDFERSKFLSGAMISGALCKDKDSMKKIFDEDKAICDKEIEQLKEPTQILIGKIIKLKRELYPSKSKQQN